MRILPVLLRAAALSSLCVLSACTPQLLSFVVPPQVRPGSVLEVAVVGDTQGGGGVATGDAGCVIQVPNGLTLLGYRNDLIGGSTRAPEFNAAQLLGLFTAEPGHYLLSFHGTGNTGHPPGVAGRVAMKIFLQAPSAGTYALKVALVGRSSTTWNVVQPPTVTQFAAITAAPYRQTTTVVPGYATDFEIDANAIAFGSAQSFPSSLSGPERGSFDDIDQDGDSDFLGFDAGLKVWRATPGQNWILAASVLGTVYAPGEHLAVGNFDGDGARDIALADGRTWFGNGGTAWSPGPQLSTGGAGGSSTLAAVTAGDVNGDGRTDLLLCSTGGAIRLHHGNANRTFTLANNGLPMADTGTAAGAWLVDLTGDGDLDLYVAGPVATNVWIGDGAGNWTPGSGLPATLRQAAFGDLDGDGTNEVILVGARYDTTLLGVLVYRHLVNGAFAPLLNTGLPTTQMRAGAAVLDVDGDGRQDVVLGTTGNNATPQPLATSGLEVWQNAGTGTFQLRPQTGLSAVGNVSRIVKGDFNGDGITDLGVQFEPQFKMLFYRGTRVPPYVRVPHGCSGQSIQATGPGTPGSVVAVTLGNSVGIPHIGFGLTVASTPLCAGCTLGHEWGAIGLGATFALQIPPSPTLSGVQVGIQGADVMAAAGCLGLPIALSDTLVLTIP
jgi:FG-GAP-like repeat